MTVLVEKLEKELARNCRLNNWDLGFQAAIDIVKQHNSWKNINNELPELQTDAKDSLVEVLVHIKAFNRFPAEVTHDYWNTKLKRFNFFDGLVTHWMPLPQTPSEVQNG